MRTGLVLSTMELVDCSKKYWEFVRLLRMNDKVSHGFIKTSHISKEDQERYMSEYSSCYRVCLIDDTPCGYVGVIDDDIRVCVHPDYWKRGIGKFMIKKCREIWPESFAKVKVDNEASMALFLSCGFTPSFVILE